MRHYSNFEDKNKINKTLKTLVQKQTNLRV